ncbi:MAG: hypothetical protein R3F40_05740 [Candidatus Competibacteraceae bacterium]
MRRSRCQDVPTSGDFARRPVDLWLERQIPTRAILMVSHSIEEVLMIADRIAFWTATGRVKAELLITSSTLVITRRRCFGGWWSGFARS